MCGPLRRLERSSSSRIPGLLMKVRFLRMWDWDQCWEVWVEV